MNTTAQPVPDAIPSPLSDTLAGNRIELPPTNAAIAGPSTSKHRHKERCHNWQVTETLVLIHAKRTEHFRDKNMIDKRDLMTGDINKWSLIVQEVMRVGFSPCHRDGQSCKTKWSQIIPEYKKIVDYHGKSGQNIQDFWTMTVEQRKQGNLPRQFF